MKTLEQLGISPAPWTMAPADDETIADVTDRSEELVCETPCYGAPDIENNNARLIAAAPELYEALAAMLHCAEAEAPFTDTSHMSIAMDMARKAIAKAGGAE